MAERESDDCWEIEWEINHPRRKKLRAVTCGVLALIAVLLIITNPTEGYIRKCAEKDGVTIMKVDRANFLLFTYTTVQDIAGEKRSYFAMGGLVF